MTEPAGASLERELRSMLRDRDPGQAPLRLRGRIDRIPDTERLPAGRPAARAFAQLVGLAAAVLIAVLGVWTLRYRGSAPGSVTSPAPSAVAAFDPKVEGPGLGIATDTTILWGIVVIVVLTLVLSILFLRGWRRFVPVALAVGLVVYALVGSLVPVSISAFALAPGRDLVEASVPPGSNERLYYVLAPARQPFSVGIVIGGSAPLPVRIEGIRDLAPGPEFVGMRWRAVWLDGDTRGGLLGPARPFAPFDLNVAQGIWLVGRTGACSVGPSFDPRAPALVNGYASLPVQLRISVLGWPRVVDLPLLANLVEPERTGC